jgi:hypothetical protein
MWISACNELLLFLFGVGSLILWLQFARGHDPRRLLYVASLLLFGLALISKESAPVLLGLFVLTTWEQVAPGRSIRRWAMLLLPFVAAAALCGISVLGTRNSSFRFHDGSFSLTSPFWITLPHSLLALLWPWGLASAVALASLNPAKARSSVQFGICWAALSMTPYIFLTYSTRIPSRQTYLASAGLAWLVGEAAIALWDRYRSRNRVAIVVILAVVPVANIGYLWTKKRTQFLERAEPTERLIALARTAKGPIYVRCFPRNHLIAEEAFRLSTGRPRSDLIWDADEATSRGARADFCY